LSPAEKLQALATPYSQWIATLLNKHVFGSEGINSYFQDWKQDRGQAYQNTCVLVYFIEKYPLPITSVASPALMNWLKRVDPPELHLRRKVDKVFHFYVELMARYQDVAITACGKKLSPIGKSSASCRDGAVLNSRCDVQNSRSSAWYSLFSDPL
jgi:hypothetical protein